MKSYKDLLPLFARVDRLLWVAWKQIRTMESGYPLETLIALMMTLHTTQD